MTKLTELEAGVLRDIIAQRDPNPHKGVGSRTVSQAIMRLRRKGFLDYKLCAVTDDGRAALEAMKAR